MAPAQAPALLRLMLTLAVSRASAYVPALPLLRRACSPTQRAALSLSEVAPAAGIWDPLGLETACTSSSYAAIAPASRPSEDPSDQLLVIAAVLLLASLVDLSHATPAAAAATGAVAVPLTSQQIFEKAAKKALGGGVSGAVAGVAQVLLLMWLRTTMNYQYRNGGGTMAAMNALYEEGGLRRFYRGVQFALVQTPLTRFGDTAANSGVLALLATSDLPISVRTLAASGAASLWRITLTPVDTYKTSLQVVGEGAIEQIDAKVKAGGVGVLYQGALANAAASFAGNYPWYLTFNSLNEYMPLAPDGDLRAKLLRTALLGISAACVSDCISNGIRVLKTTRQTSAEDISYREAARRIVETDGWAGLLGRGLGTRLVTNALQASLFTVIWKLLEDQITRSGLLS